MAERRTRRTGSAPGSGLESHVRDILRDERESGEGGKRDGPETVPAGLSLDLELERDGDDARGRFVVHELHQGADGAAHAGVIAAALVEAMIMCVDGAHAPERLELDFHRPAPVGSSVTVDAHVERGSTAVEATGTATGKSGRLASAHAVFASG